MQQTTTTSNIKIITSRFYFSIQFNKQYSSSIKCATLIKLMIIILCLISASLISTSLISTQFILSNRHFFKQKKRKIVNFFLLLFKILLFFLWWNESEEDKDEDVQFKCKGRLIIKNIAILRKFSVNNLLLALLISHFLLIWILFGAHHTIRKKNGWTFNSSTK